jgi:type II secretory pathway component PulL
MSDKEIIERNAILREMRYMREDLGVVAKKVDRLESAVSLIAVQSNRIDEISLRLGKLENWSEGQNKTTHALSIFQAGCPREKIDKGFEDQKKTIDKGFARQWAIIVVVLGLVTGTFFKVIGIV